MIFTEIFQAFAQDIVCTKLREENIQLKCAGYGDRERLQEYRRYLDEYNVYSVLTVQTKLHTTLDKTSTDRTRSCVPADVVVLGKTPRIT